MVYEITSKPADAAELLRSFPRAPGFLPRTRLINDAQLPKACSISLKISNPDTHDQDRIWLPKSIDVEMDKVWGLAASIWPRIFSADAPSPASAQILLKIPFWGDGQYAYRPFYARAQVSILRISLHASRIICLGQLSGAI